MLLSVPLLRRTHVPTQVTVVRFLAVACSKATDDAITIQIQSKMFADPLLKSASVNVAVKDGIVTLSGTVPHEAARLAARKIASKTGGVRQVIDTTSMAAPVAATEPVPPSAPEPSLAPPKPVVKKTQSPSKPEATPPTPATPAAPASTGTSANPPGPLSSAPTPASTPAPPPPQPQPITVTIPEGTIVTVRTIETIEFASSSTGLVFGASLDAPVVVNDRVVLLKGLNVRLKLVEAS
jgi:BON domain